MMQKEFENLVGHPVDNECYKRIEAVYMNPLFDDMFPSKESVADYYKKHDMQGFEKLYKVALKAKASNSQAENLERELVAVRKEFDQELKKAKDETAKHRNYAAQLEIVVENLKKIVHEMTDMM